MIFALLVLDSLSQLTATSRRTRVPKFSPGADEIARLQVTIERINSKHEMQSTLVEKLRSVGLSVASARLNLSKEEFRELIDSNPEFVDARLNDSELLSFLSGRKLTLTDVQEINEVLSRIERL